MTLSTLKGVLRSAGARISRLFEAFLAWRSRRVNDQAFLFVLAVVTGLFTGTCAAALKVLIDRLARYFTSHFDAAGPNYLLLVVPVAGIVLVGILQRYVLHQDLTHGVRKLGAALDAKRYRIPLSRCFTPMLASTITLGFGGSAGSEGPIASTGAAIGSNVGRLCRLEPKLMMIMIGCGAGAGIAGIFKAPVGGFLFTLEVLKMELTTMSVMALLLACITAAMTAYVLSGCTVDLSYLQMAPFDMHSVPFIVLLGVVCGFYSLYYSVIMKRMESFYDGLSNPWVRNVVSGGILAVLVFVFPAMYGEGYHVMDDMLNGNLVPVTADGFFASDSTMGWPLVLIVGGIMLVKAFACSAANCGGGVAGDFAPTLFAGCFVGFTMAAALNLGFDLGLNVSGFAFCGMAGVMAGTIRAPFMALFLTAEMTDGFNLFLPLLAVCGISYGIVRIFRAPVYYRTI